MAARAVVVSIAFGAGSHRLFRLMAASLRAAGWHGDIAVLPVGLPEPAPPAAGRAPAAPR